MTSIFSLPLPVSLSPLSPLHPPTRHSIMDPSSLSLSLSLPPLSLIPLPLSLPPPNPISHSSFSKFRVKRPSKIDNQIRLRIRVRSENDKTMEDSCLVSSFWKNNPLVSRRGGREGGGGGGGGRGGRGFLSFSKNTRQTRGIRAEATRVQFSTELKTDIPLRERYGVSFDQYMGERDRIFRTFFPDKERSEKLTKDEWRIHMLPMDFFFLVVRPIVDMKISLSPPPSPHSSQLITLQATRYELRGVDVKPSEFLLGVSGELYSEKVGVQTRLRGKMELSVELAIPENLSFVPPESIQGVGNVLLNQLLEAMKDKVNRQVLQDYAKYAWEARTMAREQQRLI